MESKKQVVVMVMPSRRRAASLLSIPCAAVLVVAACTPMDSSDNGGGDDGGGIPGPPDDQPPQAPELAEQVDAGDLEPLDERLPDQAIQLDPVEQVGTYGGSWRMAMLGYADTAAIHNIVGYEPLIRWDGDWNELQPGVAHDWEHNEEGTEYTFHLREGMRWSDGEPYTAHDIVFAVEDVQMNPDLVPSPAAPLESPDGSPAEVEALDDYTVRFSFSEPHGLFLQDLASDGSAGILSRYPRHYLEEFHEDYNDNIDELLEVHGAEDWVELFQRQGGGIEGTQHSARWENTSLPTINAWVLTEPLSEGSQVAFERNPYYWKVDTEGHQLPYIDEVVWDVIEDQNALALRAASGDIDFQERNLDALEFRSELADNQENGDYSLFETIPSRQTHTTINFNLNHQDDTMREVFGDKQFRIAMSHAINREEVNDLVYFGIPEPWQTSPLPESGFHNEELAKQYTEYDVDRANEILDEAGYERDGDGQRLMPNGEPISFEVAVTPQWRAEHVDVAELLEGYWDEVGVDARVETMDRALFNERTMAGEMDVHLWSGAGATGDVIQRPRWYVPNHGDGDYAPLWINWYNSRGEGGEPPPENSGTMRQFELYDEIRSTPDEDRQAELMEQIVDIAVDEFYALGIGTEPARSGVIKNNFHNVPVDSMHASATWVTPGPADPPQFFMSD